MELTFVEATNGPNNWGKFFVARFDREWDAKSIVMEAHEQGALELEERPPGSKPPVKRGTQAPLLRLVGWTPAHIIVFDLQTGEGAMFRPGGHAPADLGKHRVWVCPMFEPFLAWLYEQDLTQLAALPHHVNLPDAPFALAGYRRLGMNEEQLDSEVRRIAKRILLSVPGCWPSIDHVALKEELVRLLESRS